MSKQNTHVNVRVKEKKGEPFERMVKRFLKKVKKERIVEEIKDRRYYEKPSVTKRKAKLAGIAKVSSGTPVQIVFPEVTQRIVVANTGLADLRVGFSANGVKNTNNYYVVHLHDATVSAHYETIDLRVKVSSIFLLSNDAATATSARIAAELTNISTSHLLNSGPSGSSWSGSVGVG